MKKILKRIWNVLEVIIIVYVVFMTLLFLNKNKYGFSEIGNLVFVNVDSDTEKVDTSVKNNDLLIIKKNNNSTNNFYYYSVYKGKYIVKRSDLDLNKSNESNIKNDGRIIGNSSVRIPLLGGYLEFLHSKVGFLLFVFLPVFLVFSYQVYIFIIDSKKEQKKILKNSVVDDEII